MALREEQQGSRRSSLVAFLQIAFIRRIHRANLLFLVQEVKFLRDIVWPRGAFKLAKELNPEDQGESSCSRTTAARYRDVFSDAFFAKRSAEIWHRGYAILPGFETFASAPADVLQAMSYPVSVSKKSFGEFLRLMHSYFPREEALKKEGSRKLRNPTINLGKEEHDKIERDAGKARHTSKPELLMKHLECDEERV